MEKGCRVVTLFRIKILRRTFCLVESDEVICKILTGVTLENNKKLKRELV